jgi:hypothetical protein
MPYIGSSPTTQNFVAGTDTFSGNGTATTFTLSRTTNSVNDIQVVVNNVVQYPLNYSVSGTTLTISPAPSAGTDNVYVRYLSTTLQAITVSPNSSVNGNFAVLGNLTVSNISLSGNSVRITGDFTNATIANRAMFQSSTANGATNVYAIPNGSATTASFSVSTSSDPNNSSIGQLAQTVTDFRLQNVLTGTGSYLPMTFYTGGSERARIDTSGNLSIGAFNSSIAKKLTVIGEGNFTDASSTTRLYMGFGTIPTTGGTGAYVYNNDNSPMVLGTYNTERVRIDTFGNVGINNANPVQYATSGKVLNITGTANNSGPSNLFMTGASAQTGAGYASTEVFAVSGISSATEITRVTGTATNGFRAYFKVIVTGHTGSVGNGINIKEYFWDGATTGATQISTYTNGQVPGITITNSTNYVLIINLSSSDGSNPFNGVMKVEWMLPIDFASSTYTIS